MLSSPVLFIVFNRLETTERVFSRIREAKPARLFIAADGPRLSKKDEGAKCRAVRDFVTSSVDWPCEVRTLFRDGNLGCKRAVSGAIKWFFENVEMGIVLEDDCLPARSFFEYCERLLEYYKDDPRVGMISGHNYFGRLRRTRYDYGFITTCGVWGWAGWRRSLDGYDPDLQIDVVGESRNPKAICVRKEAYELLLRNSNAAAANEINTWDYQFCVHLIRNGMCTIIPSVNQIRNLGLSGDSTHTSEAPYWYKDESFEMKMPLRHPADVAIDRPLSMRIESFHLPRKVGLAMRAIGVLKSIKRRIGAARGLASGFRMMLVRYIDSPLGERIRWRYYSKRLKFLGKDVRIDTGVFIYGEPYVSIDDGTHIDKNCIIVGSPPDLDLSHRSVKRKDIGNVKTSPGEVKIGKECHISQNAMIFGYGGVYLGDHCVMSAGSKVYSLTSMASDPYDPSRVVSIVPYSGISPTLIGTVTLEDNVWLGINVVVSPGVEIGRDSFVRSNAYVLKSFGENSYVAGDPAEYIRPRFKREDGDSMETISDGSNVLALIIRHDFAKPGVSFFTPDDFSQQLAFMKHDKGKVIQPHVHNPVKREVLYTKEVLILRKGKLRADFYSDDQEYVSSATLEAGDVILLARGGHGFEVMEDVEMFEIKQGPYAGDDDKTRFVPKGRGR